MKHNTEFADILALIMYSEIGKENMIKDKAVDFKEATGNAPVIDIPDGEMTRISKGGVVAPSNSKLAIETADKCSTGISQKRVNFPAFARLITRQFDHGGDKYATKLKEKEFTDLICEAFPGDSGVDWVLGTCMKYMGRYQNFRREKDLLKVATYMYILWLKGGFHLNCNHDEDTKREG